MIRPRILFFADAGPAVGGGHLMRCLTLARALVGQGAECAFAAPPAAMRLLDTFAPEIVERLPLAEGTPARQATLVADLARTWRAEAVVIDHYDFGPAEEVMVRTGVHRLLVLDDLRRGHLCDLVLDANLDRAASDYPGVESLIGPIYALARPEFPALRDDTLARRRGVLEPRRLLISLGLTDVGGITERVVEAIMPILGDHQIDIVLGRDAPSLAALARLPSGDPRLSLYVDTAEMAALTAGADLAIGAGGSSVWERCCLGLPALILVLADNQRQAARALEARGAAVALRNDDEGLAVLPETLRAMLADPARLAAMSAAAASLCDGQGASRAAKRLLAIL